MGTSLISFAAGVIFGAAATSLLAYARNNFDEPQGSKDKDNTDNPPFELKVGQSYRHVGTGHVITIKKIDKEIVFLDNGNWAIKNDIYKYYKEYNRKENEKG